MNRIHKVWPSWLALFGLLLIFVGERLFAADETNRLVLDVLGALSLAVAIGVRARDHMSAPSENRPVTRLLAFTTLGVGVALIIYALIPAVFIGEGSAHQRVRNVCWAVWPVVMLCSVAPLAAIEIAVAPVAFIDRYELARVKTSFARGLGLGLFVSILFLVNFLANRHDAKWELSAGHSAVASDQTRRAVRDLTKEVKVILFYSRANEVADTVKRYLDPLVALNKNLIIERVDHALSGKLAKEANVKENGYVAVMHEKKAEKIRVGTKARSARSSLRRFDSNFLKGLIKVTTGKKVAYFTKGHEERETGTPHKEDKRAPVKLLKRQLELWQYTVKDLTVAEGLADEIPDDATTVFIMGPEKPFLQAEIDALKKFTDKGGRIFLALEGEREGDPMKGLLDALGLEFDKRTLGNARSNVPLTKTNRDVHFIWSNRYSSHASLTNVTRNPNKLFAVFSKTGSLKKAEEPKKDKKEGKEEKPAATKKVLDRLKTDLVLTAVKDTFQDANSNYELDEGEAKERFGLAAAITRTATTGKKNDESRIFILADVDVIADDLIKLVLGNGYLMADAVQWLAKEDEAVVPTVIDEDIKIVHKGKEEEKVFYGTIFGVPLLVLLLGYAMNRRRRG